MTVKYTNFTLIDGAGKVTENATMYVEDGIIKGFENCTAAFDEEVNLNGDYVMPGLMDGHVHYTMPTLTSPLQRLTDFNVTEKTVFAIKNLELALKQGTTYVRDVGSFDVIPAELTLRKFLKDGTIKGPGYQCSGNIITMTGGHAADQSTAVADGVEGVRKATRELIAQQVDLIKTVATGGVATEGNDINAYQFNEEELATIVHEAHKVNKKVAVHAHCAEGIKNALRAGIDTIEHATLVDDEGINLLLEKGAYITATFTIKDLILSNPIVPKFMKDKEKELEDIHTANFKKCYERGVKIACGTDMTPMMCPFTAVREMELMIEATGMSTMEAITIATKNTAEMLGIEKTHGTLEIGKNADFIVTPQNPLDDVGNIRNLSSVYQKGVLV